MIYQPIEHIWTEEQYELYRNNADFYGVKPMPWQDYIAACARWNREYDKAWGDMTLATIDYDKVHELETLLCV